jgi:hypothetical protein
MPSRCLIGHSSRRSGKPATWRRTRRKYAARIGNSCRHEGRNNTSQPHYGHYQLGRATGNHDGPRGWEYDRGTGCGKTARPGLWRGLRVTGVPTPDRCGCRLSNKQIPLSRAVGAASHRLRRRLRRQRSLYCVRCGQPRLVGLRRSLARIGGPGELRETAAAAGYARL